MWVDVHLGKSSGVRGIETIEGHELTSEQGLWHWVSKVSVVSSTFRK